MQIKSKLVLTLLAGIFIGVAAAAAIHAQQVKVAPAYVIAEVDVTNPATFQQYAEKVPATLAPFHGHDIVRGGKTQALEGEAPKRIVVIAFDNMEKAKGWWDSPAYDAVKSIRRSSAKSRIFIAEGVSTQ